MKERFVRIEELAMVLDVNQFTIERWYRFKRENPDNEYSKILPDFVYQKNSKNRSIRYWKESDIKKLKEFQSVIVVGIKGFMGSVTNPKKREENNNGKKKSNRGSKRTKQQRN